MVVRPQHKRILDKLKTMGRPVRSTDHELVEWFILNEFKGARNKAAKNLSRILSLLFENKLVRRHTIKVDGRLCFLYEPITDVR